MPRGLSIVLRGEKSRARALLTLTRARLGSTVTFEEPRRTLPQNRLFHALLGEVAAQRRLAGKVRPPEVWKVLFMQAAGIEAVEWLPSLDGMSVIPFGYRSSLLSKTQMADLCDFILAWGAQHGVVFDEAKMRDAA